jgi:hypothetical protein
MMDLYFEEVAQVEYEFVDQYQLSFLMMIDDWNIHQEYFEVTR